MMLVKMLCVGSCFVHVFCILYSIPTYKVSLWWFHFLFCILVVPRLRRTRRTSRRYHPRQQQRLPQCCQCWILQLSVLFRPLTSTARSIYGSPLYRHLQQLQDWFWCKKPQYSKSNELKTNKAHFQIQPANLNWWPSSIEVQQIKIFKSTKSSPINVIVHCTLPSQHWKGWVVADIMVSLNLSMRIWACTITHWRGALSLLFTGIPHPSFYRHSDED